MNTVRLGDAILGTHFLMLTPAESQDPLFLQGPVLSELEPGSRTRIRLICNKTQSEKNNGKTSLYEMVTRLKLPPSWPTVMNRAG